MSRYSTFTLGFETQLNKRESMPATGNTANDSARNGMVTEESTFSNLLMSA